MTTESEPSKQLVDRWREGDEDAATNLYERYCRSLIALVERNLAQRFQSQVDADDVIQSVFRTVFRQAQAGSFSFNNDADVWKLLVTVALNKVRNKVRYLQAGKRDVGAEVRTDQSDFDYLAQRLSHRPNLIEAQQFVELLEALSDLLTREELEVLQLRLQNHNQEEIAEKLQITDRTVRRIMVRIREKVSAWIDEDD